MNRYTKSFIGLMEMDKKGRWVKVEEAHIALDRLENKNTLLEDKNSRLHLNNAGLNAQVQKQQEKITGLIAANKRLDKMVGVLLVTLGVVVIVAIALIDVWVIPDIVKCISP